MEMQQGICIEEVVQTRAIIEGKIVALSLQDKENVVLVTSKGEVLLCSLCSGACTQLFHTKPKNGIYYKDGGFDVSSPISIYTMDEIVVVVNDFKTHGFVLNRKEDYLFTFYLP